MNKGCIIAAVVVGLIVVVCAGISIFVFTSYANPLTLTAFEAGIKSYREKNPDKQVPLENKAWVDAITAPDSTVEADIKDAVKKIAEANGGEYADIYQTTVKLQARADGSIQVLSAGKDKQFGTADDENADKVMSLMNQAK